MRLRPTRPLLAFFLVAVLLGPGTILAGWRLPCPCGRILRCCCLLEQKARGGAHCDLAGARPACDLRASTSAVERDRLGALGLDSPLAVGVPVATVGPVAPRVPQTSSPLLSAPPTPPPRGA